MLCYKLSLNCFREILFYSCYNKKNFSTLSYIITLSLRLNNRANGYRSISNYIFPKFPDALVLVFRFVGDT